GNRSSPTRITDGAWPPGRPPREASEVDLDVMHDADVPAIAREPLQIGRLTIPSRFFLAPLAGYTSLAFRLAVRQCGGLGLATTDLVNARSIMEHRPRSFELAETCPEDRPLAIQIYGHVSAEMEYAAKWVVDHG